MMKYIKYTINIFKITFLLSLVLISCKKPKEKTAESNQKFSNLKNSGNETNGKKEIDLNDKINIIKSKFLFLQNEAESIKTIEDLNDFIESSKIKLKSIKEITDSSLEYVYIQERIKINEIIKRKSNELQNEKSKNDSDLILDKINENNSKIISKINTTNNENELENISKEYNKNISDIHNKIQKLEDWDQRLNLKSKFIKSQKEVYNILNKKREVILSSNDNQNPNLIYFYNYSTIVVNKIRKNAGQGQIKMETLAKIPSLNRSIKNLQGFEAKFNNLQLPIVEKSSPQNQEYINKWKKDLSNIKKGAINAGLHPFYLIYNINKYIEQLAKFINLLSNSEGQSNTGKIPNINTKINELLDLYHEFLTQIINLENIDFIQSMPPSYLYAHFDQHSNINDKQVLVEYSDGFIDLKSFNNSKQILKDKNDEEVNGKIDKIFTLIFSIISKCQNFHSKLINIKTEVQAPPLNTQNANLLEVKDNDN